MKLEVARQRSTVSSAINVLRAMTLLCEASEPLALADVAKELGISEPTAFRVMHTLVEEGFAQTGRPRGSGWTPTMQIVNLSSAILDRSELRKIVAPPLREVMGHFGETVTIAEPDGDHIVFVDRIQSRSSVPFYCDIGKRLPLHAGAAARAILAALPESDFHAYISRPLERLTTHTRVSPESLITDRVEIRGRGYAVSKDDVDRGISGVAVAFHNRHGVPLGSGAIANLTAQWTEQDIRVRGMALLTVAAEVNLACQHLEANVRTFA